MEWRREKKKLEWLKFISMEQSTCSEIYLGLYLTIHLTNVRTPLPK